MGQQLTARRGEPARAFAAVERREARMNRMRIARAGAERDLAVDKGGAKVMRETLIKETLPDRSARKHGGLGAMACPRASAAAVSKSAGLTPWTVRNASAAGKAAGKAAGRGSWDALGCGDNRSFAATPAIGGAARIPLGRCKSISARRHKAIMESEQIWTYLSIDIRQKYCKSDKIMRPWRKALPMTCRY
jgi:hypothetical protein